MVNKNEEVIIVRNNEIAIAEAYRCGFEAGAAHKDELLYALQRARPHIGVGYSGIQRQEILRVVDEAIAKAKAKGETK